MHIELRKHFFSHKIHAAVNGSISRGEKRKKSPKVDNRESYYDTPKKVQIMTAAELEENNKEEETKEQPKKSLKERLKEQWQLMMKILQLVTCALCMGFVYDPAKTTGLGKTHMHHIGLMYTAYTGFMLINSLMIISRAIHDRIPYRTASLIALSGSLLFLITGILLIVDRAYLMKHNFYHPEMYLLSMLTTSIIFAFINVLLFLVDSVFTFRRQEDF